MQQLDPMILFMHYSLIRSTVFLYFYKVNSIVSPNDAGITLVGRNAVFTGTAKPTCPKQENSIAPSIFFISSIFLFFPWFSPLIQASSSQSKDTIRLQHA